MIGSITGRQWSSVLSGGSGKAPQAMTNLMLPEELSGLQEPQRRAAASRSHLCPRMRLVQPKKGEESLLPRAEMERDPKPAHTSARRHSCAAKAQVRPQFIGPSDETHAIKTASAAARGPVSPPVQDVTDPHCCRRAAAVPCGRVRMFPGQVLQV